MRRHAAAFGERVDGKATAATLVTCIVLVSRSFRLPLSRRGHRADDDAPRCHPRVAVPVARISPSAASWLCAYFGLLMNFGWACRAARAFAAPCRARGVAVWCVVIL